MDSSRIENNKNNDTSIDQSTEKNHDRLKKIKIKFVKKIIILSIILIAAIALLQFYLQPILPKDYLMLIQAIQVTVIGYFMIEVISSVFHDLTYDYLKDTSRSIKSLIRILGSIVIIVIIISYLSSDPIVAASIGTISGLVVGFASQNIIGNIIAGLYLAILRPFKLGDEITAFSNTGIIFDIGLISTKLNTVDNKIVLVPNASMVTTTIVLNKRQ